MINDPERLPIDNVTRNGYIQRNHGFFRCPGKQIVYAPMPKCASSYYKRLMVHNGWHPILFNDIDWGNDHVFSFISDPYKRHVKGLVEDILALGIEKILDSTMGRQFWALAPTLGIHSMGITQLYQSVYQQINWIPLDIPGVDDEEIVNKLFEQYQISWQWTKGYDNQSDDYQRALYNKIYSLFDGPGHDWYNIVHREDVCLYNNIKNKFLTDQ